MVDAKPRALVVDDVEVNRLILGRMLHQLGYSVEHAADGLEAVALVSHRMLQAQGYSLLLMDIMMPELDGLEASLRIRALEASMPSALCRTEAGASQVATLPLSHPHPNTVYRNHCGIPHQYGKPETWRVGGDLPANQRAVILAVTSSSDAELWARPVLGGGRHPKLKSVAPWKLCGMDGIVQKPLSQGQLQAALQQLSALQDRSVNNTTLPTLSSGTKTLVGSPARALHFSPNPTWKNVPGPVTAGGN